LNSVGIDEEDADDASEGAGAGAGGAEELDDEDEDEDDDVRRTSTCILRTPICSVVLCSVV
jgi:hypothetical protein